MRTPTRSVATSVLEPATVPVSCGLTLSDPVVDPTPAVVPVSRGDAARDPVAVPAPAVVPLSLGDAVRAPVAAPAPATVPLRRGDAVSAPVAAPVPAAVPERLAPPLGVVRFPVTAPAPLAKAWSKVSETPNRPGECHEKRVNHAGLGTNRVPAAEPVPAAVPERLAKLSAAARAPTHVIAGELRESGVIDHEGPVCADAVAFGAVSDHCVRPVTTVTRLPVTAPTP